MPNFADSNLIGKKNVTSADLENVGKSLHLQNKIIISRLLYSRFNQSFTKMMPLDEAHKKHHITWR